MSDINQIDDDSGDKKNQKYMLPVVYIVFGWILIGISFIYGVRFYFDDPIHPSFIPIVSAVFAATLSFVIVMSLNYVVGEIDLQLTSSSRFKGASGPIILWCLCFLSIAFGLYMLGATEALKTSIEDRDPRPVHRLFFGENSSQIQK